jgi:hypothetical protein
LVFGRTLEPEKGVAVKKALAVDQIVAILKAELGIPLAVDPNGGISEQTFYRWRNTQRGGRSGPTVQAAGEGECPVEAQCRRPNAGQGPCCDVLTKNSKAFAESSVGIL